MTLHRGEIWTVSGHHPRNVLVISGGMYNDQLHIVTVPIVTTSREDSWCVPLGHEEFAVVDHIGRTAKDVLARQVRAVDVQTLMNVNNALFKILATN